MWEFFHLFRKRGVLITMEILNEFPNGEALQNKFFQRLKSDKGELNSFFRVRKDLLKYKIIAYKLNDKYEKIIYLTEKGKELFRRIMEIEEFLKKDTLEESAGKEQEATQVAEQGE